MVSILPADDAPIIVIDDDETMRRACQAALRRTGYQVESYADGPAGLKRIEEVGASLLVVDLKMPGMSGLEVIERVKQISPDVVAIVITGFATVSTAVEAMKAGAYDFIPKPFTADELRVIIARGVERRRLTLEAKRLRKEKEAQAHKFVTFVSHQLQSPLGAVRQYLDVLLYQSAEALPAQYRQWIERCSQKIATMLEIITDWLTISKVEGGQLATQRQPVRWQDLIVPVLENSAGTARDQQVALVCELAPQLPAVTGDATALRMVLSNLVVNAVKYNRPGGEVRITARADEGTIALSVSDTGLGIAPEEQERVFEEFYRSKDERIAATGGTGMGLPIAKKIVEELGGRITLASRPGEGSTFTVVLPRAAATEPRP
ncbi:MAG: hybrid sensor histidine kinase/response regulator [Planctomycetota bacterium]